MNGFSLKTIAMFLLLLTADQLAVVCTAEANPCDLNSSLTPLFQHLEERKNQFESLYAQKTLPRDYQQFDWASFDSSKIKYLNELSLNQENKLILPLKIEEQFAMMAAYSEKFKKVQFPIDQFRAGDPLIAKKLSKAFDKIAVTDLSKINDPLTYTFKKFFAKTKPTTKDVDQLFSALYAIEIGPSTRFNDLWKVWKGDRYQEIASRLYQERIASQGLQSFLREDQIQKINLWMKTKKILGNALMMRPQFPLTESDIVKVALLGEKKGSLFLEAKFKAKVGYQEILPVITYGSMVVFYRLHQAESEKKEKLAADKINDSMNSTNQAITARDSIIQPKKSELDLMIESEIKSKAKEKGRELSAEERKEIETFYRDALGD